MSSSSGKTGGCQCGNIRYELTGPPITLYACHCTDCQKQSSSAFGMSLRMDPRDISILQGADRLKFWDTRGGDGMIKRCHFCPDCGTRIMHGSDDANAPVSIKAGSLDDTAGLSPVAHIWLKSAQPWLADKLRQDRCFAEEPEDEAALDELWQQGSNG